MIEKRILILSFYFEPDLSAGSFRTTALVKEFLELDSSHLKIDVITTLPNRYASFRMDAKKYEEIDFVTIHRIDLPDHNSGMLDQAKAFFIYAQNALRISKKSQYDIVFATSSRLMTATLGAWIARKLCVPLYLDIRDIFVDTMKDVLPKKVAIILTPFFFFVERLTFKSASHVNLVSRGFESYFRDRYPWLSLSFFTNGIDQAFLKSRSLIPKKDVGNPITVLYAGNIGEGQALHLIMPLLAKHFEGRIFFKVLGDGGRLEQLKRALAENDVTNLELLSPVSRESLINLYCESDVLFLHLGNYEAFKKVLPSKIFEYAALGKPIWAGVGGYAAEFLISEVSNVAVFSPCNVTEAIAAFDKLIIVDIPRENFIKKFQRKQIMKSMAINILSLMPRDRIS